MQFCLIYIMQIDVVKSKCFVYFANIDNGFDVTTCGIDNEPQLYL